MKERVHYRFNTSYEGGFYMLFRKKGDSGTIFVVTAYTVSGFANAIGNNPDMVLSSAKINRSGVVTCEVGTVFRRAHDDKEIKTTIVTY